MNIELSKKISINPNILTNSIDQEVVMMSLEKGKYYGLNPVGSRIWELIEKPMTVEELIKQLLDEYEIEKDQCTEETLLFLKKMQEDELIVVE